MNHDHVSGIGIKRSHSGAQCSKDCISLLVVRDFGPVCGPSLMSLRGHGKPIDTVLCSTVQNLIYREAVKAAIRMLVLMLR